MVVLRNPGFLMSGSAERVGTVCSEAERAGANVYSEKFEEYRIAGTRVRRKKW